MKSISSDTTFRIVVTILLNQSETTLNLLSQELQNAAISVYEK